jgi:hypothetical protein
MDFSIKCAYAHGTSALRTHLINMSPKQTELTWPVFAELRKRWAGKVRHGGRVHTHAVAPHKWQQATRSRRRCTPGRRRQHASSHACSSEQHATGGAARQGADGSVQAARPRSCGSRWFVGPQASCRACTLGTWAGRSRASKPSSRLRVCQWACRGAEWGALIGLRRVQRAAKLPPICRSARLRRGSEPRQCCAVPRPTGWRAACAGPDCSP